MSDAIKRARAKLQKTQSLGHSVGAPSERVGAAALEEIAFANPTKSRAWVIQQAKKKFKKKPQLSVLEKHINELEELEELAKGKVKDAFLEELEKGKQEVLDKEGYSLTHKEHEEHPDYGGHCHEIECTHPKHGRVGHSIIRQGDDMVWEPTLTTVHKDHRRKGIASSMYRHFEEKTGNELRASSFQTGGAQALWASKDRSFGKSDTFDHILKNRRHYFSARRHADKEAGHDDWLHKAVVNNKIRSIADSYAQKKGLALNHEVSAHKIIPEHSAKIAQAYHEMKHDPNHPDVKAAYDALISEVKDQYNHIIEHGGLKISRIRPGQENPYKDGSKALHHDLHNNNHMWYYPTEQGFGSGDQAQDHPMLRPTGIKHGDQDLLANDLFRIVHDYFGHGKESTSFGPSGEDNAWKHHMQMFSPLAQKALTTETRGQNSWVNFGPHGQHNRNFPANTIFAEQKAGILPDWVMEHKDTEDNELKPQIHPDEILAHDTKHSTTGNSAYTSKELDRYHWKKEMVPIHTLHHTSYGMEWQPHMRMWNEGEGGSHRKVMSDPKHVSNDEQHTQIYAKLKSPPPAIMVRKDGDRHAIMSGRHRARAAYLNGQTHIESYVGTPKLEKGLKEFAAAAAVGMTAFAPTEMGSASVDPKPQLKTIQEIVASAKPQIDLHPMLEHIAQIESSGGKNKNHAKTTVGLNAGHTAGGSTGLMPIMIRETIEKNKNLKEKYGHLLTANHDEITRQINENPEMEHDIANHHWARLDRTFGDDQARKAFAWRNGITAAKQASHDEIEAHPYVRKFQELSTTRSVAALGKSEQTDVKSRIKDAITRSKT
jgi:hypothetical protein